MKIIYLKGDATQPTCKGNKIIAHICNDVGGWGRGFVLAISKRWSEPEKSYRDWYASGQQFNLGEAQLVQVKDSLWVANMIGQHGVRTKKYNAPIRYEAVEKALQQLADGAIQLSASIHMPRIGCGLAGGRWERIESIIARTLLERGVETYVYDL